MTLGGSWVEESFLSVRPLSYHRLLASAMSMTL